MKFIKVLVLSLILTSLYGCNKDVTDQILGKWVGSETYHSEDGRGLEVNASLSISKYGNGVKIIINEERIVSGMSLASRNGTFTNKESINAYVVENNISLNSDGSSPLFIFDEKENTLTQQARPLASRNNLVFRKE